MPAEYRAPEGAGSGATAGAAGRPAGRPPRRIRHAGRIADLAALGLTCLPPLAVTAWGLRYYTLAPGARLRHPLHAALEPVGGIGLAFGLASLALFLFMWAYPLRKTARWLAWTGPLGSWMRVHVVAGLTIPLLAAVHAGWRFDGLIGLGYFAMFVVTLSGMVGRYLYVRIPRARSGLELSLEEIAGERRGFVTRIAAATGLVPAEVERRLAVDPAPYEGLDPLRTVGRMLRDDVDRARKLRELRAAFARPAAAGAPPSAGELRTTLRLARREVALAQQVRMLEATRRVFAWWHVAHRPFALTALLAVSLHVLIAVVVGHALLPHGH